MNYKTYKFFETMRRKVFDVLSFLFTPLRKYYQTDFSKKRQDARTHKTKIKKALKDIYRLLDKQSTYSIFMGFNGEYDFDFDADRWRIDKHIIDEVLSKLKQQNYNVSEIDLETYIDNYIDVLYTNGVKSDNKYRLQEKVYVITKK